MASTETVAEGVWRHAGDLRDSMNVYFVRDGDGVLMFDAGTKGMVKGIRKATDELGGLTRIVLGHSHTDHRGSAPELGVPVFCHEDEAKDARGDGGLYYFTYEEIPGRFVRWIYPKLLSRWDGGPVEIAGTLMEGDEVAGFEVVHFPGHAPGLIALWRESDGVALTSDVFYVVNPVKLFGDNHLDGPTVPHTTFNKDNAGAARSVRKLAELGPRIAFPGHHGPLEGEQSRLREQLEAAADAGAPGRPA